MMPEFHINDFDGPLDLLLHLVKESKMDIYEINTAQIIEQYLAFIQSMEDLNIDVASEYLIMASELIHLKSKLLIHKEDAEDVEDEFSIQSEEDLKNKLLEYEKFKNITGNFRELEEKRKEVFTKLPDPLKEYMDGEVKLSTEVTLDDLLQALALFQERQQQSKPLETTIARREMSVAEKTKSIRHILKEKGKVNFIELFETFTKENVVVTFLSILEMSKNDEILLTQEDNFSNIMIEMKVK